MDRQTEAKLRASRLGKILRALRKGRRMTFDRLADETGIGKSYLAYLEQGKFSDVGLDKFARVVAALGTSADQVLVQAGYMSQQEAAGASLQTVLREQLNLSPEKIDHAMSYLQYLGQTDKKKRGSKK